MRTFSSKEQEKIKFLTSKAISLTFIEPTATGLGKSILDATGPVRNYLSEVNVHDYSSQKQGKENKAMFNALLIKDNLLIPSKASLYRPKTKKGDPRIWFKHLGEYAKPNDILGIIVFNGTFYVINITRLNIEELIKSEVDNPLKELINELSHIVNEVADELLYKLRKIASRGAIPALLNADTAIGRTLEHLLGIKINSLKTPDYKGIELKSYRDKKRANRKSLFAQVPDWKISKFKSSEMILNEFGYLREGIFRLYCTVSTQKPNTQGLQLRIDKRLSHLFEHSDKKRIGDFVTWQMEKLHERLLEKHNETFWIGADSKFIDGKEYFTYSKVTHTRKPIISQFDILLEQGIITLDHLIKRNKNGNAQEKGPFFKLNPKALDLLFPPSKTYNLHSK